MKVIINYSKPYNVWVNGVTWGIKQALDESHAIMIVEEQIKRLIALDPKNNAYKNAIITAKLI
jgi:hypothetical protein